MYRVTLDPKAITAHKVQPATRATKAATVRKDLRDTTVLPVRKDRKAPPVTMDPKVRTDRKVLPVIRATLPARKDRKVCRATRAPQAGKDRKDPQDLPEALVRMVRKDPVVTQVPPDHKVRKVTQVYPAVLAIAAVQIL